MWAGVAGGTASGKTTVCDMIIQQLHDHRVVLVNQDSFYRGLTPKELANVGEYNFDHPGKVDGPYLVAVRYLILLGGFARLPWAISESVELISNLCELSKFIHSEPWEGYIGSPDDVVKNFLST